jgi:hypothetical protein
MTHVTLLADGIRTENVQASRMGYVLIRAVCLPILTDSLSSIPRSSAHPGQGRLWQRHCNISRFRFRVYDGPRTEDSRNHASVCSYSSAGGADNPDIRDPS